MTDGRMNEILTFWFAELTPQDWLAGGKAIDDLISKRFAETHEAFSRSISADALLDGDAALAAIIVLDQFSRNIHRGTAKAFSQDRLARALTYNALRQGFDQTMDVDRRQFLYMPLMHSEELADQEVCVSLFEALNNENNLKFAREHRDVIARFGRFPHRNAVLGRANTAEEEAYLETANRYGQ